MSTLEMSTPSQSVLPGRISLRAAAVTAGLALLAMTIAAPFAEFYAMPRIFPAGDAAAAAANLVANRSLLGAAIAAYLVAFGCDVLAAWALYLLLKPANDGLSLLTAFFRLVYAVLALAALLNLVTVWRLLDLGSGLTAASLASQAALSAAAFRGQWQFSLLFFGLHLGLLGILVFNSKYVPWWLGVLLSAAGLGYLVSGLRPFVPGFSLDLAAYTAWGELIFMLWLLAFGSRLREPRQN